MREANARRKMAENSLSRPPMPMSSNLKFGARIALGGALSKSCIRLSCSASLGERNVLFRARLDLDRTRRILDKVDLGLTVQDARLGMTRGSGALALKSEVVQALDGGPQVLTVKVKHEGLADRDDQAVVSAAEDVLELVGRIGSRLGILFEPVRDLVSTGIVRSGGKDSQGLQ